MAHAQLATALLSQLEHKMLARIAQSTTVMPALQLLEYAQVALLVLVSIMEHAHLAMVLPSQLEE